MFIACRAVAPFCWSCRFCHLLLRCGATGVRAAAYFANWMHCLLKPDTPTAFSSLSRNTGVGSDFYNLARFCVSRRENMLMKFIILLAHFLDFCGRFYGNRQVSCFRDTAFLVKFCLMLLVVCSGSVTSQLRVVWSGSKVTECESLNSKV